MPLRQETRNFRSDECTRYNDETHTAMGQSVTAIHAYLANDHSRAASPQTLRKEIKQRFSSVHTELTKSCDSKKEADQEYDLFLQSMVYYAYHPNDQHSSHAEADAAAAAAPAEKAVFDRSKQQQIYGLISEDSHFFQHNVEWVDENTGYTAFTSVAKEGDASTLFSLLDSKPHPSINHQDNCGYTALNSAAKQGHDNVVSALLSFDTDPNLANQDGSTPLHFAVGTRNPEMVNALVDAGADVSVDMLRLIAVPKDKTEETIKGILFTGHLQTQARQFLPQIENTDEPVRTNSGATRDYVIQILGAMNDNGAIPPKLLEQCKELSYANRAKASEQSEQQPNIFQRFFNRVLSPKEGKDVPVAQPEQSAGLIDRFRSLLSSGYKPPQDRQDGDYLTRTEAAKQLLSEATQVVERSLSKDESGPVRTASAELARYLSNLAKETPDETDFPALQDTASAAAIRHSWPSASTHSPEPPIPRPTSAPAVHKPAGDWANGSPKLKQRTNDSGASANASTPPPSTSPETAGDKNAAAANPTDDYPALGGIKRKSWPAADKPPTAWSKGSPSITKKTGGASANAGTPPSSTSPATASDKDATAAAKPAVIPAPQGTYTPPHRRKGGKSSPATPPSTRSESPRSSHSGDSSDSRNWRDRSSSGVSPHAGK